MKSNIVFGETKIEYKVVCSNRKNLEISIEAPDVITVRAPMELSDKQIEQGVRDKAKWIVQKLYLLSRINNTPIIREYIPGESFMYLGRNYSLRVEMHENLKQPEVKLYRGRFILSTSVKDEQLMRGAMEEWYKEKALEIISKRVDYYSRYFNRAPCSIKIKSQKTRWGSCTSKNDLLFNYKVIMAPSPVIDYIVVHEMCHMEYKDHSRNFWRRVRSILPDYENRKSWLRENGIKMDI